MRGRGLVLPLLLGALVLVAVLGVGATMVVRTFVEETRVATAPSAAATQTTTVRAVDGGVELDIVLTLADPGARSITVLRQYVDQDISDPQHVLHEQVSGLVLDDVRVDGAPLRGSGRTYPPVEVSGSTPIHITGTVRPYADTRARVAWIAPPVLGIRLTQHTITFTDPPAQCGIQKGVIGAEQRAVLAPCPATSVLHLPTGALTATTARVEY